MKGPIDWNQEFHEFAALTPLAPPAAIDREILAKVRKDLHPSAVLVFLQFTLAHAAMGALTLLWCPQFGISPLSHAGMPALYMQFGETFCDLACGMTFLGFSALAASLFFRPEALRILRRYRAIQLCVTALMTLLFFQVMSGNGISAAVEISSLTWLAGAILGGWLALELGWRTRRLSS